MRQYTQLGGIPCNGTAFETKECGTVDCPSKFIKCYYHGYNYGDLLGCDNKTSFHVIIVCLNSTLRMG